MSKNNISDELIITTSARLSNEVGLNNLSLKMIAEELNIKSPSLYNHISSLDDIKEKLMIMLQITKVYLLLCCGTTNLKVKKKMRLQ